MRTTVAPTAKVPSQSPPLTEAQTKALEVKRLARKRFREGVGETLMVISFVLALVATVVFSVLLGVHFTKPETAFPPWFVYSMLAWDLLFLGLLGYNGIRYQYDKDKLIADYLVNGSDPLMGEEHDPRERLWMRARGWEQNGRPEPRSRSYEDAF